MRQKVVEACSHAWKGYMDHAYGFDDLRPLTATGKNWYGHSLLMTPVDAFDTFHMLGMKKEAEEAKKLILDSLRFDRDMNVQVFEITIRLLAGLETAFETTKEKRFLTLATDLADRLLPAFETPTGMPFRYVNLVTGKTSDSANNPAEIGTLLLEFGHLSQLTGNPVYLKKAKKAILAVYERRAPTGLVGTQINVLTGRWINRESHISGMIDSYFEYLYKGWKLFGDPDLKKAWEVHQAAIKKYLIVKNGGEWFLTHADMDSGKETAPFYGALDAFYAGLCAYSGDVSTGRAVQAANFGMWKKFGMEPEEFNFRTDSVTSAYYILRPENLESCFYLFRSTRDPQYLWMGKRMVDDILLHCRTDKAFASLKDVRTHEQINSMQSFFFAETLKYAYLLFADAGALNLEKYVLNTEAHPFRIRK
jgi:mannosidase alpha-like ER degradation enhancer 2